VGISDGVFTGDVWRALQELDRKLQNLTSGRRLEDASVGARGIRLIADEDGEGGTLTIDGGTVRALSAEGVEIFAIFNLDGTRAWKLAYDDGPTAIGTLGNAGNQFVAWWDHSDNIVFSTDAATSTGLARPYLNIPIYPSNSAQHQTGGPFWPATNSTSFVELMHGVTTIWQPRIAFGMAAVASGGTTEWRLLISGTLIASGSGSAQGIYKIPTWGEEGGIKPGHEKSIQVEVRNTAGSVSWCQVDKCYGTQS
jgi:hypothetical protein